MTNKEAIAELKHILLTREALIQSYRRKKSWRASEVALAIAGVQKQIAALDHAIQKLSEENPK